MNNQMWTADGRLILIDANNNVNSVDNVIEPFSDSSFTKRATIDNTRKVVEAVLSKSELESTGNYETKKIIFVEPKDSKTLNDFCFYQDKNTNEYIRPPVIEISGDKCPPGSKNSQGMRIKNIRAVNDLKGTGTILAVNNMECEFNKKKINDAMMNLKYFGDCNSDPSYWKEVTDKTKLEKYNKMFTTEKISKYIPKLKDKTAPYNPYAKTGEYQVEINDKLKTNNEMQKLWRNDQCLGGGDGKDGVFVRVHGNKCDLDTAPHFGMDVQKMEMVDKKGNLRYSTEKVNRDILMSRGVIENVVDEKRTPCVYDFTKLHPLKKKQMVGDCNTPPELLRLHAKYKERPVAKDNYIDLAPGETHKTQDIKVKSYPGLNHYPVVPKKPEPCESKKKPALGFEDCSKSNVPFEVVDEGNPEKNKKEVKKVASNRWLTSWF